MKISSAWVAAVGVAASLSAGTISTAFAQTTASCDHCPSPARDVKGGKAGPSSCQMQETDMTFEGRAYKRLDLGLDGTVEGYLTKTGSYKEYLTNAPELVFPQTSDPGPIYHAIAAYERAKGAAMTIVYPADAGAWNRKMWVR